MSESIENIRLLLEEITIQCDANWIAFSGGLDSSILAQIKKTSKPKCHNNHYQRFPWN